VSCSTCQALRQEAVDHLLHGRITKATATVTKGLRIMAGADQKPAVKPPPVVPRPR